MTLLKWLSAFVLVSTLSVPANAQTSTLDKVKERGTLIAGVKNDYPPAGYINDKDEWVGFDVEIAAYIAKKLGVELKLEPVTSRTRIPLLVNGNIDLTININPTRERAQVIDFTQPYFLAGTTLLVKNSSGIKSVEDLVGKKVSSVQGSNDAPGLAQAQPKADIVYFQEFPEAFMALKQDRVDAMVTASITLMKLKKDEPDMTVIMPPFKPDPWAIGVRQDDSKWRLFVEEAIMDAWVDGTIAKLHEKYIESPVGFELSVWPDYFAK